MFITNPFSRLLALKNQSERFTGFPLSGFLFSGRKLFLFAARARLFVVFVAVVVEFLRALPLATLRLGGLGLFILGRLLGIVLLVGV